MTPKQARFERKCADLAVASIGKTLRVKTSKSSSFSGEIISAEYAGTRKRQKSMIARFKVSLKHPTVGTVREFTVEKLPRW